MKYYMQVLVQYHYQTKVNHISVIDLDVKVFNFISVADDNFQLVMRMSFVPFPL